MKAHTFHNFFDKAPFDPIIGFTHIKLNSHETILPIPFVIKVLGGKFKPLNEMLGNQTETQLWALEMTPIGFRCDDKPIQARRNKNYT